MFPFYMMLTNVCKNSRVVSSDFSMIINSDASSSSSLLIKLICCFKSVFSNSVYLLKSIAISL